MPVIYVAQSKTLSDWGSTVGISKSLFKVGLSDDTGKEAVGALNEEACAGMTDWKLVKADDAGEVSEAEMLARLDRSESTVDPKYYPRIKGAPGIIRVRPQNVENDMLVEKALAGEESLNFTIKPADVAAYLIKKARGGAA